MQGIRWSFMWGLMNKSSPLSLRSDVSVKTEKLR